MISESGDIKNIAENETTLSLSRDRKCWLMTVYLGKSLESEMLLISNSALQKAQNVLITSRK